ncbi:MAG: exodeoxyribonuclease III [Chitinophagaceae bacterium]|nr:exodeoxyribonuclease III [Chitinophagaceae bacterium]
MKIVSYNVNGIRSAISKGLIDWVREDAADIYCFQELKASLPDIPSHLFEELGYHCYWYPAQKKGYSGVGIISKQKPDEVIYGCGLEQADAEGRVLQLIYPKFRLINTYFPSGSSGDERQSYKMEFLNDYLNYLQSSSNLRQSPIILAGDYNICHQAIDIHDPKGNKDSSGFLPEERAWMDRFFEAGMVDSFRLINQEPHQYSWWSFRANARNNNKGWRIDYINVSEPLKGNIKHAEILPHVKHSDHCPVMLEMMIK